MSPIRHLLPLLCAALLAGNAAWAQDALIRKNLAERLPQLPKIDEISKTPIPGIYEVRIGAEILYADEQGNHLIQGNLVDTKTGTDLTEARLSKLSAIDFASLPLKDALVIKQGSGTRRLVVFGDPNCGYCKRFERDLANLQDVTIYTFLYPILGPDSSAKSRDIWCAKDSGKVWRAWMVDGVTPPKNMGACDSAAMERNVALGKKHRVQGTPAVVFEDGTRIPGAIPLERLEKNLAAASKKG
jgi:thiol:disulfide interchange protein DsbC